jgi:outer membrane protein OmpA-like peptidoglycan-associated protein
MRQFFLCSLLGLALLLSGLAVAEIDSPSTDNMIEQLKPKPAIRKMRKLEVEQVTQSPSAPTVAVTSSPTTYSATTPSAPPSLSLNILFDFNSDRINPNSQVILARLANALQSSELMDSRFAVEGHTDAKGNPKLNLRLSQQRADAVRNYLLTQGIESHRLVASGKGATELANPLAPYSGENRRVKIINLQ